MTKVWERTPEEVERLYAICQDEYNEVKAERDMLMARLLDVLDVFSQMLEAMDHAQLVCLKANLIRDGIIQEKE